MGEDRLLAWLRAQIEKSGQRALIGDDTAPLPAGGPWEVTVDTQIEGVHFPAGLDPAIVARRLLAVNLSDLAAAAAEPAYGFLSLSAPEGFDHRRFLAAFVRAARRFGVRLAGGDLARSPRLTAVLTLIGERPQGRTRTPRGAAKVGDGLYVGGCLGESAAGRLLLERGAELDGRRVSLPHRFAAPPALARAARRAVRRHLEPRPQLELGRWLGSRRRAAAIDVSDGLAKDLDRLLRASGVAARVEEASLPASPVLDRLAELLGVERSSLQLEGGEDYVLLFTLPRGGEPPPDLGCRRIGRIVAGRGMILKTRSGERLLAPAGWDHLSR